MQRDEGVLFRGARLAQAHEWREQHHDDLNDLEREFLDASDARQVREAAAEQARQRRELEQAQALAAAQQQRAEEQARATKRLRSFSPSPSCCCSQQFTPAGPLTKAAKRP